jgi:hypothetical protein
MSNPGKEEEEMYLHYMQLNPSLIKERHEQLRAEMSKRRLVKQLRKHHEGSGPRLLAYFLRLKSTFRPLRRTGTAGQ